MRSATFSGWMGLTLPYQGLDMPRPRVSVFFSCSFATGCICTEEDQVRAYVMGSTKYMQIERLGVTVDTPPHIF